MSQSETGPIADRLQDVYRRYVGEPESLRSVYAGFGLFFGGIGLAIVGVAVFLWSVLAPNPGLEIWQLREIAVTLTSVAFPVFLFSIVVLLPVKRQVISAGALGGVICLGGVAVFVWAYPYQWNVAGQDYSATGVLVYSIGAVMLAAATGASLVANYIAQAQTPPSEATAGEAEAETVSEEEVRRDIEEAMAASEELTWGGIERRETKRLNVQTDDTDVDTSGLANVGPTETRSGSVDNEVEGLKKLRGNETRIASGEGVDDQTEALKALRAATESEDTRGKGLLSRIRSAFGL